ncbi:hypothetical protein NMY22_g6368 [Coprinellus aureogranulatus]|nr:hypothetical protein NMY22_g6368 [Coprinellus aureogranulatus]
MILYLLSTTASTGSIVGMSAPCYISSNPDISGIGVRLAIYIQNLLGFIPAIWAIWDGHVSDYELESAETQSTTNLVLAFAILISCIVQALTLGLTNYHAVIVLSLSWMNNTNAFIYFLLYVQYKGQGGRGQVEPRWKAWIDHVKNQIRSILYLSADSSDGPSQQGGGDSERDEPKRGEAVKGGAKVLFRRIALLLGSLHLTLMAALGIWLWSKPATFGVSDSACAVEYGQLAVLGARVPFGSNALRIVSLVLYSLFLLPGLNLLLPMTAFLCLYFWHNRRHDKMTMPVDDASEAASSRYAKIVRAMRGLYSRCMRAQAFPVCVGLGFLFAINVVFIADIEFTLHRNIGLQDKEEAQWGFGQILALLLVLLPMRDLVETILARRLRRQELQIKQHELSAAWAGAILRRDLDRIVQLVKEGADPNVKTEDGWSALEVAVFEGCWDSVPILVHDGARRADINISFHDGRTALETVALTKDWDGFYALAAAGANIHAKFTNGQTVLELASRNMNWEVVTYLINAEVDASLVFVDGTTALEYAVCAYNWDLARSLIAVANADVNTIFKRREGHFNTVLHAACVSCPDIGFVAFLLEAGANPNIPVPEPEDGVPRGDEFELPLQRACRRGPAAKDIIDLLFKYGADPNAQGLAYGGGVGGTTLQRAAAGGVKDVVDQLLKHGADPNLRSDPPMSALQLACRYSFVDVSRILLEGGADPNDNGKSRVIQP